MKIALATVLLMAELGAASANGPAHGRFFEEALAVSAAISSTGRWRVSQWAKALIIGAGLAIDVPPVHRGLLAQTQANVPPVVVQAWSLMDPLSSSEERQRIESRLKRSYDRLISGANTVKDKALIRYVFAPYRQVAWLPRIRSIIVAPNITGGLVLVQAADDQSHLIVDRDQMTHQPVQTMSRAGWLIDRKAHEQTASTLEYLDIVYAFMEVNLKLSPEHYLYAGSSMEASEARYRIRFERLNGMSLEISISLDKARVTYRDRTVDAPPVERQRANRADFRRAA